MLFSLVVPVYNTKEYLKTCLDSIESQSFDDFELIIVDDGSTDGSGQICESFCESFNSDSSRKRVARVIHQDNQGLSGARNTGIREAKGEWIWFIDSDDSIVPEALASMHERMKFAKGDMYAFQYIRTDEKGENPENIFFRESQSIVRIKGEGDLLWNLDNRIFPYKEGWEAWSRLYNRSIIEKNKLEFKDTKKIFAEDICFLTEYMMCIKTAVMLVNYYYCYRQRSVSLMNSLDQKTVIPRLINLLEDNYHTAKRLKKRQSIKNFDTFCYGLLKSNINKLYSLTDEEIRSQIVDGERNRSVGKYLRKVEKRLFDEIDGRNLDSKP